MAKGTLLQNGQPQFEAKIPAHLLDKLSEQDRWLHERVDIAAQQTEHILRVQAQRKEEFVQHCADNAREFSLLQAEKKQIVDKLAEFDTLRVVVASKWSVVAFFGGALLIPLCIVVFGEWMKRSLFGK